MELFFSGKLVPCLGTLSIHPSIAIAVPRGKQETIFVQHAVSCLHECHHNSGPHYGNGQQESFLISQGLHWISLGIQNVVHGEQEQFVVVVVVAIGLPRR